MTEATTIKTIGTKRQRRRNGTLDL